MPSSTNGFSTMPITKALDADPYLAAYGVKLVRELDVFTLGELSELSEHRVFAVKTSPENRERFLRLLKQFGMSLKSN